MRILRKTIAVISICALASMTFSACSQKPAPEETKETPATKKTEDTTKVTKLSEVDGTLVSFQNSTLTLESTDKQSLSFPITSKAEITCQNMLSGDNITVLYEGAISGSDTSKAVVVKVEDKGTPTAKSQEIVGTVVDASMNTLTIKTNKGNTYSFSTIGAELNYKNGIELGNWIHITYTGTINGADTSGVKVTKVVDDSDNIKEEQKKVVVNAVNDTVWATAPVNVRESYTTDSKVLGSLAPNDEITRNGLCDNGWARVSYHGKDAYIYNDYLTTTKPAAPTAPIPPVENPQPSQPTATDAADLRNTDGYATNLSDGWLTLLVKGSDYRFNVANAQQLYQNGLLTGNMVTVSYYGDLDRSEEATVYSVIDNSDNMDQTSTLTGYIQTSSMNCIVITTEDNAILTVSIMDAAVNTGGLSVGQRVKVTLDLSQTMDDSNIFYASQVDSAD